MNKILTTILTFSVFFIFGQTNRFIYQLDWKMAGQEMKTNMVLDIDKDFVKFYDYKFLEMDSINKKFRGNNNRTNTMADQLLIRKRNSSENKTFHDNNFDYFVLSSKDKMNWKVTKETKKLDNYKLQKATTSFGGREWTAWFSPEIPFQEGPFKFAGLPGLIFELNDKDNEYSYKLVKSINLKETFDTKNFLETHYGINPVPVTLKQYHKVKLDYYSDPVSDMKKALSSGGTVNIMGENITTQEQLDQKRKFMQQMIKKFYNPIEKDKAIPYPEK